MEPETASEWNAVNKEAKKIEHEQHLRMRCLELAIQGCTQGDDYNIMSLAKKYAAFILEGKAQ